LKIKRRHHLFVWGLKRKKNVLSLRIIEHFTNLLDRSAPMRTGRWISLSTLLWVMAAIPRFIAFAVTVFFLCLIVPQTLHAETSAGKNIVHYDAEALIDDLLLTRDQREKLSRGQVIAIGLPQLEQDPKELASILLVQVPGRLDEVANLIKLKAVFDPDKEGVVVFDIVRDADAIMRAASFGLSDRKEVQRLLNLKPGVQYNFSQQEIFWFQKAAVELVPVARIGPQAAAAVSEVYQRVLHSRYRAYRKKGLSGIPPYCIDDGQYHRPANELRIAAESVAILKHNFPEFHKMFVQFPGGESESSEHYFFVVRRAIQDRPCLLLSHWIVDLKESYALIAQRQYYVGHTYDSLQIIILCLPYKGGTLVSLLNQTFTDKVTGILSSLRHCIGRHCVQEIIRPIFEKLRAHFVKKASKSTKGY
jgi:hypothetical protein